MKAQHQNLQDHRSRNYNAQEANLNAKAAMPATKETLNQDNRICYKS
ncbi:hypothetical protein [Rickettsia conorii]|nr:hypothetical protein [Rickettsia conorii]